MSPDARKTASGPVVLVTATTWWPSVAILASSLEQAGFSVVLLAPRGHVGNRAQRFRWHELDRARPIAALADMIRALAPALVVPGDDRAVAHLIAVGAGGDADLRAVVTRSLGPQSSQPALTERVALLTAADQVGLPVPLFRSVGSRADLEAWMAAVPPPWVLKVDGAWGGEGVAIVANRLAADDARRRLARGMPPVRALWRARINGDPFWLLDRRTRRTPQVSAQAFVDGWPGSCALFAQEGDVLGATIVEASGTCGANGPSTQLRAVNRPDLLHGARRLVRKLRLSGFVGLDFMVEASSGRAVLIEMNPRITMPARMPGPFGLDPISAAARAFGCSASTSQPRDLFASFPIAWLTDPFAPDLARCGADVPWHEPAMLRASLELLWVERGTLTRLPAQLRRFRHKLAGSPSPNDHRHRPFTWWIDQGLLPAPLDRSGLGRLVADRQALGTAEWPWEALAG